jgi:hypothetical protein
MLSYEDFITYYGKYGRFPDAQYSNPDKILNERQLKTKYEKYIKRQSVALLKLKNKFDVPETFEEDTEQPSTYIQKVFQAEKEALERDPDRQEFWINLTDDEINAIHNKIGMFKDKEGNVLYDPCHVISRTQNKILAYDPDNIIYMPRYCHSLIDIYKNFFTLKSITKEEREDLWKHILGEERYNRLQDKK